MGGLQYDGKTAQAFVNKRPDRQEKRSREREVERERLETKYETKSVIEPDVVCVCVKDVR